MIVLAVTIKEILAKYPSDKIDSNSMDDSLLNHEVPRITIEDIEKPSSYEDNDETYLLFRTKKNYIITISQHTIGQTWKDKDDGYIHTFHMDDIGTIINT